MQAVGEKNGLTISKWRCTCGKSIDVKPLAGTTGTARWHDKAVKGGASGGEGKKAGTAAGTGTLATFSVFLASVSALFSSGETVKAQADAVEYCQRLATSIADRRASIKALEQAVEQAQADAEKARASLIRQARMLDTEQEKAQFEQAISDALAGPKQEQEQEQAQAQASPTV